MSAYSQNGRPRSLHLNEETMRRFQDRSLAQEEWHAAHQHLNQCGSCRRALRGRIGPLPLPEEIDAIPEPLHLGYEQITAYLDNTLRPADKQRAEAHLFLCVDCNREIEGLRKLDAQWAAEPVRTVETVPESKLPLAVRLARFFRVPGRAREMGMAFGVIVMGLFLFQAGRGTTGVSRAAARVIHLGADSNAGLSYGGYGFIALGLAYMLFSLFRKR